MKMEKVVIRNTDALNGEAQKLSKVHSVFGFVRRGFGISDIADMTGLSVEMVQKILSYSQVYAAYRKVLRVNKIENGFSNDTMPLYRALVSIW